MEVRDQYSLKIKLARRVSRPKGEAFEVRFERSFPIHPVLAFDCEGRLCLETVRSVCIYIYIILQRSCVRSRALAGRVGRSGTGVCMVTPCVAILILS